MCRWAAYLGAPIFMEEVVVQPGHSLIHQSQEAEEAKTAINADGFGVAWYNHRAEPGSIAMCCPRGLIRTCGPSRIR